MSTLIRRRFPAALGSVLVVACLFLPACSSDDSGTASPRGTGTASEREPRDVPPGDPNRNVTRADVDAAVARIPDEVRQVLDESGVPGAAVTVVFDDEVVYAEGFGVADVDTEEPVDSETVFQLASLSKPISATVVSALVARGDLEWDDPVVEYTPEFALSDPAVTAQVSVGDLFSHRSGLPEHAGDLLEDLGYDRDEILSRLSQLPLEAFRNDYAYTNFGLTAGAVAAAAATGGTWEDLTDEVLFDPAGMDRTTDSFEEFMAQENRASPHVRDVDGDWIVGAQRDPQAQAPAGGVASSAEDLGTWMRIQLADGRLGEEQIIPEGALMEMRTPQVVTGPPRSLSARSAFYGYGLGISDRDDGFVSLSHSGAFLMGAATAVGLIPGQDLGVSVITNGQPVGAPEALREIIIDLIADGEVTKDWLPLYWGAMKDMYVPETPTDWAVTVADPAPARDPSTYVGIYSNPYYGPLEVREAPDGLEMVLGPQSMVVPLTHYDGDSFLFTPPGENAVDPTGITFACRGGTATSVSSEFYDAAGLGTWARM